MGFRTLAAALVPLLAAGSAVLAGCGSGGAEAGPEGEPPPVTVEVFEVASETLRDVERFSGQLDAEYSVMLRSETDGVIESITFEEGERVSEGDVLFHLKSEEQRARLAEAKANLALAREEFERTRNLVTRDAASQAQKDRADAELSVAKARVDLAEVELSRTRIRAPFDGVAGLRLVSPGDRVTDETPLVQVDAVDRLQVSFPVSEQGVRFARIGAPIEVMVGPYPGETFPGEVFFVSPTLDPRTRRILLKAWVPNEHGRLRAGLFANVDLEIDRRENALRVPESAIVYDRGGTYVWRVGEEGRAERVPIEVGLRQAGLVEVTLGLRPGDRVVSAGVHKVSEGSRLVAKAPRASGQTSRRSAGEAGRGVGPGA